MADIREKNDVELLFDQVQEVIIKNKELRGVNLDELIELGRNEISTMLEWRGKEYIDNYYVLKAIQRLGDFGSLLIGCAVWEGDHSIEDVTKDSNRKDTITIPRVEDFPEISDSLLEEFGRNQFPKTNLNGILSYLMRFFGKDLGYKLYGMISISEIQLFGELFEKRINKLGEFSNLRSVIHFNQDAEEATIFASLIESLITQKILLYLNDGIIVRKEDWDPIIADIFENILRTPYSGFWNVFKSEENRKRNFVEGYNGSLQQMANDSYDSLINYIDRQADVQEAKEEISDAEILSVKKQELVKATFLRDFNQCANIEEKLRLVRQYIIEGKDGNVLDGDDLISYLGLTKGRRHKTRKQYSNEQLAIMNYAKSLKWARPILEDMYIDRGMCLRNKDTNYKRVLEAIKYRQRFEAVRRKKNMPPIKLFDQTEDLLLVEDYSCDDDDIITMTIALYLTKCEGITSSYYKYPSQRIIEPRKWIECPEVLEKGLCAVFPQFCDSSYPRNFHINRKEHLL